jgi:hypothetical protein
MLLELLDPEDEGTSVTLHTSEIPEDLNLQ